MGRCRCPRRSGNASERCRAWEGGGGGGRRRMPMRPCALRWTTCRSRNLVTRTHRRATRGSKLVTMEVRGDRGKSSREDVERREGERTVMGRVHWPTRSPTVRLAMMIRACGIRAVMMCVPAPSIVDLSELLVAAPCFHHQRKGSFHCLLRARRALLACDRVDLVPSCCSKSFSLVGVQQGTPTKLSSDPLAMGSCWGTP
jgi:hypothetical protein